MITDTLKTILADSGCTLVLYESDMLSNVPMDRSNQTDIIGLITQLDQVTLEVRANAVQERYNPLYIAVMKQVRLEDFADQNEVLYQQLLDICKEIIVRLIAAKIFKKVKDVRCTKIRENQFDANMLGWSMTLDLTPLINVARIPC